MTESLDATLLAAIEEWRDVWRQVGRLDDEDPAIGGTAEKAIKLERKIEPPPIQWTPVVGSRSQEVFDGKTSATSVHGRLQAAGG